MAVFAEVTENECINARHRHNEYIQFQCSAMTEVAKVLPLIFWLKLIHPAVRSLYDTRATCTYLVL